MNCQEVMELMQRQLDDDLSDAELEVLMNHTRQCPDCAAMFERMKQLSAELSSLPKVTPSYSLVDAILPELERLDRLAAGKTSTAGSDAATSTEHPRDPRRIARKRRWPAWSAIGSVVAAGIVAGLFIMNDPSATNEDSADKMMYSIANMAPDSEGTSTLNMTRQMDPVSGQSEIEVKSFDKTKGEHSVNEEDLNPGVGGDLEMRGTYNDNAQKDVTEAGSDVYEVIDQAGVPTDPSGEAADSKKDMPNFGIAALNEYASPDGRFIARLEQHAITILSADNGKAVMETSRKNGQHSQIAWSEDSSQLSYEVQLDRGAAEKYVIETSSWKEKKASH